ncbi:MAG: hypothetical protein GX875_07130 [Propionibacterium sp.]|nr:hypothetical protein [Propionibacterium sp.]
MSAASGGARSPFGLALTAGFFSIIPMPVLTQLGTDETRRALRWFPTLGALFGIAAGAVGAGTLLLSGSQLLAATLVVLVWQALTGAMHLDGLADSFDGLAALGSHKEGRDAARALEIMRTPDTGAMGVAAIVLALLVQVAALAAAPDAEALFALAILAPMTGRAAVLVASRPGVPAARKGGFGALFHEVTPLGQIIVQLIVLAAASALLGWWVAGFLGALGLVGALVIALGVSVVWVHRLTSTFAGLTGDLFGALIEVTTTVTALAAALMLAAVRG